MPVNAGIEYGKAEEEYLAANTPEEKLIALQKMLSLCPKHKGSEKLQKEIKEKIKKVRDSIKKAVKKGGFQKVAIKKEGAALIVIAGTTNSGKKKLLDKELSNINVKRIIYNNEEHFEEKIWNSLNIIKVYTKQPGKEKDYPPVALKKGSIIEDLTAIVHKDFLKNFKYAIVNGKSAKFSSQRVGLKHKLEDEDIVEFHTK